MEMSADEKRIWDWAKNNIASVLDTAEHFGEPLSFIHQVYKKGGHDDRNKESQQAG